MLMQSGQWKKCNKFSFSFWFLSASLDGSWMRKSNQDIHIFIWQPKLFAFCPEMCPYSK